MQPQNYFFRQIDFQQEECIVHHVTSIIIKILFFFFAPRFGMVHDGEGNVCKKYVGIKMSLTLDRTRGVLGKIGKRSSVIGGREHSMQNSNRLR